MSGIDRRRGMTLIEVLIAMTMTLIVLGAMMAAFRYASGEISKGRAMIELSNQLRIAQEIMRTDLEGVTVDMRPWAITAGPNGYFEYIEGVRKDNTLDPMILLEAPNVIFGDFDDVLAMTVRGKEFHGRFNNRDYQSNVAEVVWWASFENRPGSPSQVDAISGLDYDESIKVYRRQLLILPNIRDTLPPGVWPAQGTITLINQVIDFVQNNDISVKWVDTDGNGSSDSLEPNSVEDLAKRENRFCHWGSNYPHLLNRFTLEQCQMANLSGLNARFSGNDIMISDVLGFDVQVFSTNTDIRMSGGIPLVPSDRLSSYTAAAGSEVDQGTFVDLGWRGAPYSPTAPEFSTLPNGPFFTLPTLDTFCKHYESNGVDDDGDGLVDEATNGLDDDGANGVDDNGERETLPPYPFRIAGIKVSFRIVERTTKQVRQTSVVHSFLPK